MTNSGGRLGEKRSRGVERGVEGAHLLSWGEKRWVVGGLDATTSIGSTRSARRRRLAGSTRRGERRGGRCLWGD